MTNYYDTYSDFDKYDIINLLTELKNIDETILSNKKNAVQEELKDGRVMLFYTVMPELMVRRAEIIKEQPSISSGSPLSTKDAEKVKDEQLRKYFGL